MPEMPEVEAVRRVLEPQLRGRRVASVAIAQPQIVAHPGPDGFASAVEGREIVSMGRRGKFLTMALGDGGTIVLHLRMTGHLLVLPANFPVQKHTHLVMGLSDGMEVRYVDPRRFGRFWYLAPGEEDAVTGMAKLGPEPLDAAFTGSYLKEKAGSRSKAVKEALHDQSVVAGIGNIYSDEILFKARIRPDTRCKDLSARLWNRLAREARAVIESSVAVNAMTPEEYREGMGEVFHNMEHVEVYGRAGEPCLRCGSTVRRMEIGGRGSYYCLRCQRKRPPARP